MGNAGAGWTAGKHEAVYFRVKQLPTRKGKAEDGTLTDTQQGKVR
jgi:hypothetical protein